MISLLFWISVLLFVHWVADFIFQTDKQAKNKSKSFKALISHTAMYSAVILCVFELFRATGHLGNVSFVSTVIFTLTQFISHTIIDYFTSKLNSKLWAEGAVHDFFVSVGFDQLLHTVILIWSFFLIYAYYLF